MEEPIVNKVAQSGLIVLNLEQFHTSGKRLVFDLKDYLAHGFLLQEKPFREALKNHDWTHYLDAFVVITCSTDAIVPTWAYMLVSLNLEPFARKIVFGTLETLETLLFEGELSKIDFSIYSDKRVVIKGCGDIFVPISAYTHISAALRPYAQSILYGEPCSTVPLYKKKKEKE